MSTSHWARSNFWESHVAADQDVGTERTGVLGRQVADHPAVDQHTVVDLDGREHARQGHAGAQRFREEAVIEHLGGARFEIGRYRREREGQLAEVAHAVHRPGEPSQQLGDALPGYDALGQLDRAAGDRQREDIVVFRVLAIDRQITAVHGIGEQPRPVY